MLSFQRISAKYNYSRKYHNNARNILKINIKDEVSNFQRHKEYNLFYRHVGKNYR